MSFPPHATSTNETKSLPTEVTPLNAVNELCRIQQYENIDTSSPLWCFFVTLLSTFRTRTQNLKEIHRLLDDYFSNSKTLTEFLNTVLTKFSYDFYYKKKRVPNFVLDKAPTKAVYRLATRTCLDQFCVSFTMDGCFFNDFEPTSLCVIVIKYIFSSTHREQKRASSTRYGEALLILHKKAQRKSSPGQ
jgi:hypothetical protein